MPDDPTKLTNQPSLTTSSGRSWLILGLLLSIVSWVVLLPLRDLPPVGLALGAAIAIGALYIAMIVVRLAFEPGRRRLAWMAAGMIGIAVVSLVAVGAIAVNAAGTI